MFLEYTYLQVYVCDPLSKLFHIPWIYQDWKEDYKRVVGMRSPHDHQSSSRDNHSPALTAETMYTREVLLVVEQSQRIQGRGNEGESFVFVNHQSYCLI